jgi:hypothetical protein
MLSDGKRGLAGIANKSHRDERSSGISKETLRQLVEIGGGSNRDISAQAGQSFPRPTRQRNSRPITLANTL